MANKKARTVVEPVRAWGCSLPVAEGRITIAAYHLRERKGANSVTEFGRLGGLKPLSSAGSASANHD